MSSAADNTCRGCCHGDLRSLGPGTEVAPKALGETRTDWQVSSMWKGQQSCALLPFFLGLVTAIDVLSKRYIPETASAPLVTVPTGGDS